MKKDCCCQKEEPARMSGGNRLPEGAVFAGSSPLFTDKTLPKAIQCRHMAPKNKLGKVVVQKGALEFVWEDTMERLTADPAHPVLVCPERYHHVEITGPVEFRVEFYHLPEKMKKEPDPKAVRPGEAYL